MLLTDKIDELIYHNIPENRRVLSSNITNLHQIANYCDANYMQAKDKNRALAETKNFATQSLAHVAYQIHKIASDVITLLDLQVVNTEQLESTVSLLGQTVAVHKEKVARREIGVLTANKTSHRIQGTKNGLLFPQHEDTPRKYVRTDIDYSILDNIGHGVKTQPAVKRSASQVQRPRDTKLHANIPLTGTISRQGNLSRQVSAVSSSQQSQYRVPIAAPNVPSHYAPGHYTGHRATPPSTPHSQSQTRRHDFTAPTTSQATPLLPMPGLDLRFSDGNVSPPLPPPPPVEYAPYTQSTVTVRPQMPPSPVESLQSPTSGPQVMPPAPTSPPVFIPPLNTDLYPEPIYIERVRAIYDYTKDKEDELTFGEGSIIMVTKKNDDGWFEGVLDGMNGLFPGNYVESI